MVPIQAMQNNMLPHNSPTTLSIVSSDDEIKVLFIAPVRQTPEVQQLVYVREKPLRSQESFATNIFFPITKAQLSVKTYRSIVFDTATKRSHIA
jgi:hypothetical protein